MSKPFSAVGGQADLRKATLDGPVLTLNGPERRLPGAAEWCRCEVLALSAQGKGGSPVSIKGVLHGLDRVLCKLLVEDQNECFFFAKILEPVAEQ